MMRVAAAHQVPVAGARHRIAVLRVVNYEYLASAELEPRVRAVIVKLAVAVSRPAGKRNRVAEIIAVDDMHRQAGAQCAAQRLRPDHVAAMDNRFGALRGRLAHRARERIGAVVAVRYDANLHADAY